MKFSEMWLREWCNPPVSSEALATQLSLAGLEVESVTPIAAPFNQVVVGKIIDCQPHPNAARLKVTTVDVGDEALLTIICGANNCRQGLIVAVALEGAILPGNFKIKKSKLRGLLSYGMLCAYEELSIDHPEKGIIELPETTIIGSNVRDVLQLDDNCFTLSVTPNRADCLNMIGLAREVAAINRQAFVMPTCHTAPLLSNSALVVNVHDKKACPNYLGRVITEIDISRPTPLWMKNRLLRSGYQSINIIVDITNYVLLAYGQPLHAFDLAAIEQQIAVRFAQAGESLQLLNDATIALQSRDLIIADANKPLALAGILGGKKSAVSASTKAIFLESAFFDAKTIFASAQHYHLQTEASYRYERAGIDAAGQSGAIERATTLILDLCGGKAAPITQIVTPDFCAFAKIELTKKKLQQQLGCLIDDEEVTAILSHLGCDVKAEAAAWVVTPPSWRHDILADIDLVEEVGRIYGFHRIKAQPIVTTLQPTKINNHHSLSNAKNQLVSRGYQEVINYSFVHPELQQQLLPHLTPLQLNNPISADKSMMRLSLLPGLLNCAVYNQNRQQNQFALFEAGMVFIPDMNVKIDSVKQVQHLAGLLLGTNAKAHWSTKAHAVDFYDIKGDVESLFALCGLSQKLAFFPATHAIFHPGQTAAISLNGKNIGVIGALHPKHSSTLGLKHPVMLFEIAWQNLPPSLFPKIAPISALPINRRDISIIVEENISAEEILKTCRHTGGSALIDINLFDIYSDEKITAGNKSLSIALFIQGSMHTLTEQEIATLVTKCVAVLKSQFNALLRE